LNGFEREDMCPYKSESRVGRLEANEELETGLDRDKESSL